MQAGDLQAEITEDAACYTLCSDTIRTEEEMVKECKVDLKRWRVARMVCNKWDQGSKRKGGGVNVVQLWQIKLFLELKKPDQLAAEQFLERITAAAPKTPRIHLPQRLAKRSTALEISITDLHLGMRTFRPAADGEYNPEIAQRLMHGAVEHLLALAENYGPFKEIVLPWGNDYLHVDNVFHTTTKGTPQPEADSWHHTFDVGIVTAIGMIDRLKQVAPVRVLQIPGNHDRHSSYALGKILWAWYRNDANVFIDAGAAPYKFYRFGCTLLGFEHGHSIASSRLAGLMANACPADWAETAGGYREWHLGDQHRKASARPSHFEEQGVAVEYLPSLCPANEWHKINGYNHQQRSAVAFVYCEQAGPIARLQANVNALGLIRERAARGGAIKSRRPSRAGRAAGRDYR